MGQWHGLFARRRAGARPGGPRRATEEERGQQVRAKAKMASRRANRRMTREEKWRAGDVLMQKEKALLLHA